MDLHDIKERPRVAAPHVVLLGAGASRAAFPKGDATGRRVPLMNELPGVLLQPWRDLVESANPTGDDFESQFAFLKQSGEHESSLRMIEKLLYEYFSRLRLPTEPTIYDHLVLGLREKDLIATFNWDPFLMLAYERNRDVPGVTLPDIRFLHGSVRFAYCPEHSEVLGVPGMFCPRCDVGLKRSPILFPIADKNYAREEVLWRDWRVVTDILARAGHLTIFGYSGPKTDCSARTLLREAWWKGANDGEAGRNRNVDYLEVVDVVTEADLEDRWKDLIPFHHFMSTDKFWTSTIGIWPRRTMESRVATSVFAEIVEPWGSLETTSLNELQARHQEIEDVEI